jgi:hypothetical protein
MRFVACLFCLIAILACNLSATPPLAPPPELTEPPPPAEVDSPPLLATITVISDNTQPTLPPLPNISVTSAPALGGQCEVYITYSGARADNRLSMRAEPGVASPQMLRVPNNIEVYRIPGSQEVQADGYHWLHMIYVDAAQARYQGWIARDSFETNGVRDPSIATLRATGTQAAC